MASPPLPIAILFGIYLGLLTGILPAVITLGLGFLFRYLTGVTVPAFAVVVMAVAIAGVNGGFMALADESIRSSPTLVTALIVVLMLTLYAHNIGDTLGAQFPRRLRLSKLADRTLSTDVIRMVGASGRVTVKPIAPIGDLDGYPPLPDSLRQAIAQEQWELPADIPISELETRVVDQLKTRYELAGATVSIEENGNAHIQAAPPAAGVSARLDQTERAVSIAGLVPSGLARGDIVRVTQGEHKATGRIVSAKSGSGAGKEAIVKSDGGEPATAEAGQPILPKQATTTGGTGRVTLAATKPVAESFLKRDDGTIVVPPRGDGREFSLIALLRRAGLRFDRFRIQPTAQIVGQTLAGIDPLGNYNVMVLALRQDVPDAQWVFTPPGSTQLTANTECYILGKPADITAFREVT